MINTTQAAQGSQRPTPFKGAHEQDDAAMAESAARIDHHVGLELSALLTRFQLQRPAPAHRLASAGLKPAAVLLPIVPRAMGLQLLLTRRSRHLRHHAGQISFPGGRQDPHDRDLIETALRETDEELGIPACQIQVLGTLNPLNTVSHFEVLPVLGLLNPAYPLTLSPDEVEQAFEVPLQHLLNPTHHIALTFPRQQHLHTVYWIPWQQHFIWGATASMIRQLAQHIAP